MTTKEVIDIVVSSKNTMQEGIEMLQMMRLENEKLKSLLPKWQPIDEIDKVEMGCLVVYKDRKLESLYSSAHIIDKYTSIPRLKKLYTYFIILPKL
jgi:regulator of replication initiation timing